MIFIVHTMPQRRVYLKMGLPDAYVLRASGDVYVITGPVFEPNAPAIGEGRVRVPRYLFKLVYDATTGRSWAHWQENREGERVSAPISYRELVRRTGVEFLPTAGR